MKKEKKKVDPCPFCQGKASVKQYCFDRTDDNDRFWIGCISEECLFQPRCGGFFTEDDAISMWNKEPDQQISLEFTF